MTSDKILALIVAFVSGAALTALVFAKMMGLAVRHSPRIRQIIRDGLDREDARHALVGDRSAKVVGDVTFADAIEMGAQAAKQESKDICQLCIDPIDKPYSDERGERWRGCPNPAAYTVKLGLKPLRICEQHFAAGPVQVNKLPRKGELP